MPNIPKYPTKTGARSNQFPAIFQNRPIQLSNPILSVQFRRPVWSSNSSAEMVDEEEEGELSLGTWPDVARIGDFGGANMGFLGVTAGRSDSGKLGILAHSYNGAFYLWWWNEEQAQWKSSISPSGHFGPVRSVFGKWGVLANQKRVFREASNHRRQILREFYQVDYDWRTLKMLVYDWLTPFKIFPTLVFPFFHPNFRDLSWSQDKTFLLSTSFDQTTRLFSRINLDKNQSSESSENFWAECARPQVHGHDIRCMTSIESNRFASGAEEKVIRVFRSTRNFRENFEAITGYNVGETEGEPEGAAVPALGLSNKAVFEKQGKVDADREIAAHESYMEDQFTALNVCFFLEPLV